MGNFSERGKDGVDEDLDDFGSDSKQNSKENTRDPNLSLPFDDYLQKFQGEGGRKLCFELESLEGVEKLENYGILPMNIFHHIFLYLFPEDNFNVFLTCRLFHRITQTNFFWKDYHSHFFKCDKHDKQDVHPNETPKEPEVEDMKERNWKKAFYNSFNFFDFKRYNAFYEKHLYYDKMIHGDDTENTVKFIVVGDSGVGKSCLLNRFVNEPFQPNHKKTIGVDFSIKTLHVGSLNIKLQIWDTSGEQRFRSIVSSYYRGGSVFLVCFDVNSLSSFHNIDIWVEEIRNFGDEKCWKNIVFVGCKVDKEKEDDDERRQVTRKDVKKKLKELEMKYFRGENKEEEIEILDLFLNFEDSYVECSAKDDSCCTLPFGFGLKKYWTNNFLSEKKRRINYAMREQRAVVK